MLVERALRSIARISAAAGVNARAAAADREGPPATDSNKGRRTSFAATLPSLDEHEEHQQEDEEATTAAVPLREQLVVPPATHELIDAFIDSQSRHKAAGKGSSGASVLRTMR